MAFKNAELATLDIPDDPQAQTRLDELTHSSGVRLRPADTYEARDPSGFVIVTVNKSGLVTNIRIRPRWTDHIRPADLPAALYGTYVTAVQRSLAVELTNRTVHQPPPAPPGDTGTDSAELSLDEWMSRAKLRLDAIDDEYDTIRRQAAAPVADFHDVRSPLGYLTLRMRGRGPVALHGDPQALDNPSEEVLSEDAAQLFVRAGLGVDGGQRQQPAQQGRGGGNAADDEYFAEFNVFGDDEN
ncbi:hypothetical protein JOF53_000492 [Crossiella equi]|uniref:Uncharacterized protein n=1 Tax=Crossiella equi TaxID=130796 RepID=A0ABS5A4V8_9PSEU|nr:hypothetical protein [Crossiella equi]MBP2471620.1 hypothetical protein [Crossiella equi]